jgi:hypothetical protein
MQIQKQADLGYELLFPELPRVLFSLNGRAAGNGVYASPVLTGTPTADLVAPTATTHLMPSSTHGLARSGRPAVAGRQTSLATRLGLSLATPARALDSARVLRAFGLGQARQPFQRGLTKVSRQ